MGFAGVDVNEVANKMSGQGLEESGNQERPSSDLAPDSESLQNLDSNEESEAQAQEKAAQLLELDKVEKFKFQGKEWTAKDLEKAMLRQSDYTKKTQELSQERKFFDNLAYDLENVRQDPSLASKFKEIYPEKFHAYLKYIGSDTNTSKGNQQAAEQVNPNDPLTPLKRELEEMKAYVQTQKQREMETQFQTAVQKHEVELEKAFSSNAKKYPLADEESVLARLQAVAEVNGSKNITAKTYEMVFKQVHDRNEAMAKKYYGNMVNKQKTANKAGRDIGPGGATPGHAPQGAKTLKEATANLLADLNRSR